MMMNMYSYCKWKCRDVLVDGKRRKASKLESEVLENIILGGLMALNVGHDVQSVATTCNFIIKLFFENIEIDDGIFNDYNLEG